MTEIIDRSRLEVLVHEIFWHTVPTCRGMPFKGHMVDTLGVDSLDAMDLASEFHFRFDMLSGSEADYLLQYKRAEDWLAHIYSAANDPEKRFGFLSSGSTGEPKQVYHSKVRLLQERDFWLDFTEAKGLLCLVPVRHIYGFIWGLLLGSHMKRALFLDSDQWHRIAALSTPTDLIIGHPAAWQHIDAPFPHLYAINSAARMASSRQQQLLAQEVNGLNIYGSSETAAMAWQYWGSNHFELLPYWQKQADTLIRDKEVFEIPDHLNWYNERQFDVLGRRDALVQIGGENVSLDYVRERLKLLHGVEDVWVKPYNGPWGVRLYSYFQLKPKQSLSQFKKELPKYLRLLPPTIKPRQWECGYTAFNKFEL